MNTEYTPDSTESTAMIERQPLLVDGMAAIRRRRRRNQVLTGAAAGVAFAVLVVGCLPRTTDTPQTATGPFPAGPGAVLPPVDDNDDPELDDAAEEAFEQQNPDSSHGLPDQTNEPPPDPGDGGDGDGGDGGGGSGDGEIPPGPQVEPHPCDLLPADGSSLVALPDPVMLASNVMDGEFQVTNCSDGDVEYTVEVNPKVALDDTPGTALPGETFTVGFHIDGEAYGDGAIQFKVKVSEPNHTHYVDVNAYNPQLGWETAATDELSAGEGVGGCSNQCIVSAQLRNHWQSPNVDLDVVTDTPAKIRVYVSTIPPLLGDNGLEFVDVAPVDVSSAGMIEWTADLQPLQPDTLYYIMVTATDADGEMSTRIGSFRSITPVEHPDGIAQPGGDSGCATQCITSALLSSGADYKVKQLAVVTHTPATMEATVSRDEPTFDGSVPSFSDSDVELNSGVDLKKNWDAEITGLFADTTYHIIVQATDSEGRTSYRVGQFHTAEGPTFDVGLTLLGIRVDNDGDSVGRGEVSFAWAVGESEVARMHERKVGDGAWVTFSIGASYWPLYNVSNVLPLIRVAAADWDPFATCTADYDMPDGTEPTYACGLTWNVATSGIVFAEQLDELPSCAEFGMDPEWAEFGCMSLASKPNGDNYPSITAIVAVQVQPG